MDFDEMLRVDRCLDIDEPIDERRKQAMYMCDGETVDVHWKMDKHCQTVDVHRGTDRSTKLREVPCCRLRRSTI